MYAEIDEEVCIARNSLAVVTYWCQGKHKCQFRTSDIEAAATFKQFFIPDELNVASFEQANRICVKNGGSIAQILGDSELIHVRNLLYKKKRILDKTKRFWIHNSTSKNIVTAKQEYTLENMRKGNCTTLNYKDSTTLDLEVRWFYTNKDFITKLFC